MEVVSCFDIHTVCSLIQKLLNKYNMQKISKIYVAGHRGLVGSAIVRKLEKEGFENVIVRKSSELDLRSQQAVEDFFEKEKPEYVFLAAAKVGGIHANNTYPADFIYDNLTIATNVIHAAYKHKTSKLLNLGSSCIYPKFAPQPISEESLLTGLLEPTNEAYAIAKIAAIKLCKYYNEQYGTNFISLMPTNLYGPNDNFDLKNSHVLPALIRKFVEAKERNDEAVPAWGTGSPKREFLHADDLADCAVYLMQNKDYKEIGEFVNVGTGEDVSIKELSELIQKLVGFTGRIAWDSSKPDGTPRKLLNVEHLHALGWKHSIDLEEGVRSAIDWYLENR